MSVALLLKMDVKLKITYQTYHFHRSVKNNFEEKKTHYADLTVKWNYFIFGVSVVRYQIHASLTTKKTKQVSDDI